MNKLPLLVAFITLFLFACKNEHPDKPWKRNSSDILVRIPKEPTGLNPLMAFDANSTPFQRYIYQFLEQVNPLTGQLEPQLLSAPPTIDELEDGSIRYRFEIHPRASWDDGTPITGWDYLFSMKLIMNPHIPAYVFRPYLSFVKDIRVNPDNPKEFSAITKEPYILSEEVLTNLIPVLPKHLLDPNGIMQNYTFEDLQNPKLKPQFETDERLQAFAKSFISEANNRSPQHLHGSGPYRLQEWIAGERLIFVKKDNWWAENLAETNPLFSAYPPSITLKPIEDATTAATLIRSENVDIADMLAPRDFVEMKADSQLNAIYSFDSPLTLRYYFIYINNRNPKLDDPRVRRALAHLTNVEQIIRDVFYGLGKPLSTPILPDKEYYAKELPIIPYDVERAKTLLSEAGWIDSNGNGIIDKKINGQKVEMQLQLIIAPNEANQQLALLFQESAKKAGIQIEIQSMEFKALRKRLNTRNYELANGALAMQYGLDDLAQLWHTHNSQPGGMNRTFFGSKETDQLIEQINRTLDKEKRNKLYKIFQRIWYEEQPVINIMAARSRIALHRRFQTFTNFIPPGYYPQYYPLNDTENN